MKRRRRKDGKKYRFGENSNIYWKYCPECGKRNGFFLAPKEKCECGKDLIAININNVVM